MRAIYFRSVLLLACLAAFVLIELLQRPHDGGPAAPPGVAGAPGVRL